MSVEKERQFVSDLYFSPSWKRRVANMSDHQIIAIYLKERGKKLNPSPRKPQDQFKQLKLF